MRGSLDGIVAPIRSAVQIIHERGSGKSTPLDFPDLRETAGLRHKLRMKYG